MEILTRSVSCKVIVITLFSCLCLKDQLGLGPFNPIQYGGVGGWGHYGFSYAASKRLAVGR